ncbi:MAG: SDR family oxidoreductase [Flavobacteriales bacterium]|nr:SDR family oxidoreductase [Flavobacteriales bacterium]
MKKCILITGGTGKIGKTISLHFAKEGHRVLFTSTTQDKVDDLLKVGRDLEGELIPIISAFENDDSASEVFKRIKASGPFPSTIIHNARSLSSLAIGDNGVSERSNLLKEYDMAVAFPYQLTMKLRTQSLKNIVFVSSIYGMVAPTPSLYDKFEESSPIQYGIAKSAQLHLTKELAVRLAPEVRVNAVSYGGIMGRVDTEFQKRYKNLTPMQKMLDEKDVIGPIDFLVSDKSKDITGQNIPVDGGWTIW